MASPESPPESGHCALAGVVPFTMTMPMFVGCVGGSLVAGASGLVAVAGGSEFDRRRDRPCGIFRTEWSDEASVRARALSK